MRKFLPAILLIAIGAALAAAPSSMYAQSDDEGGQQARIKMKDGRVLDGIILEESEAGVKIRLKYGEMTVPWEEISEVIRGASITKEYEEKLKAIDKKDTKALLELARWCEENGLGEQATQTYEAILKIDTNHAEAREALGFVRTDDGKWVTGADARRIKREKRDKERVARREKEAEDALRGIPWGQAEERETDHYKITCNSSEEVRKWYVDLLESTYDAYNDFFKEIGPLKTAEKSRVFITRNHDDFVQLVGNPSIGGFYTTATTPSIPARTIVAYHGAFGATGRTENVLLHEIAHQFERFVLDDMYNIPTWLIEGLAVFFEESKVINGKVQIREKGATELGIIPRERVYHLKRQLEEGQYAPLNMVMRVPQPAFHGGFYVYGWSLVYWLINADGGSHRDLFYKIMREGRSRRLTPDEIDKWWVEETGVSMEDFQEKVWKPYYMDMKLPPSGVVSGKKFTSETEGCEIERPSKSWKMITTGLSLVNVCRMKHTKIGDAAIDLYSMTSQSSRQELEEQGREGVVERAFKETEDTIWNLYGVGEDDYETREDVVLDGYDARIWVFVEQGPGSEFEGFGQDEDEDDDKPKLKYLIAMIPTVDRFYRIDCQAPQEKFDTLRKDFDKAVESFYLLQ